MNRILIAILLCLLPSYMFAQDDLLSILESEQQEEKIYVDAVFKGTRLINGHSTKTRKKGVLDVVISHRFGRINSGAYELFGLDDASIRIGAEYGITDNFNIGFGRSSFEKTYDGFLKYKILRQSKGEKSFPVSLAAFSSIALTTLKTSPELDFSSKLSYNFQVLLSHKFNSSVSIQISPTIIHKNFVETGIAANRVYALGAGGRLKLTKRLSLNVEYFYQFDKPETSLFANAFAVGFDIETGGHVFQLHFTNAQAMIEKGFITETRDDFFDGDIHFGFNISRTFQLHD
jgi:hypothetical protein